MRLLVAILATLAAAAPASAATISVRPAGHYDEVHYVAAPGEANRVLIAYAGDARSVTVTDPGAAITATAPCVVLDAHTARCTKRPEADVEWLQSTRADLADGDDELRTTRPGPAPIGGVIALGGAGADRLDGGAGADVLHGGAGSDTLLGGDGDDVLADGDTEPDVVDGGPGTDTISFAARTDAVEVRVGAFPGIENATGGAGDDTLVGTAGANALSGGAGEDTLVGGAGGDALRGGAGDDDLRGGDGDDVLRGERGTDLTTCGRDTYLVHEPKRGEWLERGCEAIRFAFGVAREDSLLFAPRPFATSRTAARFSIGCPHREALDGEPSRCRGTLTLREATSARRLVGRGTLHGRFGREARPVTVTLTPLGRRLSRRDGDVTATLAGRGLPARSWTFPL